MTSVNPIPLSKRTANYKSMSLENFINSSGAEVPQPYFAPCACTKYNVKPLLLIGTYEAFHK